ncbi:MAG: 50S ribosomal protein L15 [Caldimicrobium sp.]|uniref:Large ribosomal subunit protein uL15 n=1 Tax=Caldimicrobium thiodismutans TaxID=1653476 RepID=A0A2N7PL86_9BACT|nr:MAG: 50S ribosomal protein L15 [Caldimicrobium thiodismutans]
MSLSNLRLDPGSKHRKKRVGRGHGSGHGKTSCRGHKGQKARTGLDIKPFFEGGQTPIIRRVPKRGFRNPFKVEYNVVNVKDLVMHFKSGEVVDPEALRVKGLVKGKNKPIKLLGDGEINVPLVVRVHKASRSAIEKIEKVGGKVEVLPF